MSKKRTADDRYWYGVPRGETWDTCDELDGPNGNPKEPPICCGEVPPETDRFDPTWPNPDDAKGEPTRTCKTCGKLWCLC